MRPRLTAARLLVAGDRGARRRLLGIVAGVMVGVALFLLLVSASQAFAERSLRSTWTQLISADSTVLTPDTVLAPDQTAATTDIDYYDGRLVTVLLVSTTPGTTFTVPGSDVVPRPGEYLASPALAQAIASVPAEELAARYGQQVGTLDPQAVEGPDSLVAVVGVDQSQVLSWSGASDPQVVTHLVGVAYQNQAYRIIALIGAIAVLVPVAMLIAIVTDLGAAQRAERYATLRLIGATPATVATMSAAETAATTLVGAVLGVTAYVALVPLAARIEISTSSFYPEDLLTSPKVVAATVLATVLGSALVAWWRTRRAGIGPLGSQRERRERPVRAITLAPLVLGVCGLAVAPRLRDTSVSATTVALVVVGAFVLTLLGLLWSGPLMTAVTSRLLARRAHSAAAVIAYNRVAQHPRAAFRAVGGLVVALYTVTVFAVAITAAAGVARVHTGPGYLSPVTLYTFCQADSADMESAAAQIAETPGVTDVVVAWTDTPAIADSSPRLVITSQEAEQLGAGPTATDTGWVSVSWSWLLDSPADPAPASAPAREGPEALPVLLVSTESTTAAIERARTAMTTSGAGITMYPVSRGDNATVTAHAMENQFATLAYIGILIAASVSTVSLGVSTIASLLARRRVLGVLRLMGMPPSVLRATVAYETVLPVSTVLLANIGLGVLTAWAAIHALTTSRTVGWPGASYYAVILTCLALVGLAVVASARAARTMARGVVRFE